MIIQLLSADDIKKEDVSNFYHSANWIKAIEESYKFKSFIIALKDDKKILNILPFFLIKSNYFGSKLISLPYGDYGGFIFSYSKVDWIIKKLNDIAKENNVDYIEIREPNIDFKKNLKNFETKFKYYTFILKLNQPIEDIWKSFDKKVRNSIRKAEKSNLKVFEGDRNDLKEFYGLYIKTMKKLGSPPHSFEFFDNVFKLCHEKVKLLFADYDNKKIAASIFFLHKKKIYYWKNVSDEKYLHLRPNDSILYKVIEWGQKANFESLDFGRTRMNTGGFLFKKRWGGEMKELNYYYKIYKNCEIPDPDEEKYKFLGKVWKILPIFLIKKLGPMIRKNFP